MGLGEESDSIIIFSHTHLPLDLLLVMARRVPPSGPSHLSKADSILRLEELEVLRVSDVEGVTVPRPHEPLAFTEKLLIPPDLNVIESEST